MIIVVVIIIIKIIIVIIILERVMILHLKFARLKLSFIIKSKYDRTPILYQSHELNITVYTDKYIYAIIREGGRNEANYLCASSYFMILLVYYL